MTADNAWIRLPALLLALALTSPASAARFIDWLGDGSMLVASGAGPAAQIAQVRAPGASLEQRSFAARGVFDAAARPYTSDAFVYAASGSEGAGAAGADAATSTAAPVRLYLQQPHAAARALAETRMDSGTPAWAHDGRRLAFTALDRGIWVVDPLDEGTAPRQIVAANGACWRVFGWSIDDATLLVGRESEAEEAAPQSSPAPEAPGTGSALCAAATTQLALYRLDVASGALHAVLPYGAPKTQHAQRRTAASITANGVAEGAAVRVSTARFASDGHAILLLTRAACQRRDAGGGQFQHLCYTDPASGDWRELSTPSAHDVEQFDASPDGRWIAYTLNVDGISRLMLLDQRRQLESVSNALGPGVIHSLRFDPAARTLALTYESARSAPDVYALDPLSQASVRWTDSDDPSLDAATLVQPQVVRFPTWDQADGEPRQLSALLYTPLPTSSGPAGPRPVVIWLCGGEAEQCRPRYAPFIQYLIQKLGVAILAPNVHGSSGYGLDFEASGSGPLREDAVRDVGSLLVWISLQPGLDHGRVALLGEGFGSYLALASLAQFGDRLSGAIAAFPRRQWSLPNALAIRRPVLLAQGPGDPSLPSSAAVGVPSYQVAQLREGLRANGVAVQYVAMEDAGNGPSPAQTPGPGREAYSEAVISFLSRVLR